AARGEPVTESERSVAVGTAAPGADADATSSTAVVKAHTRPTRAATRVKQPSVSREPPPPPRRRKRRPIALIAVPALMAAGLATGVALVASGGGDNGGTQRATRPLSAIEVRDLARAFADAYEAEDARALRRLLTTDVQRVLPSGVARGRPAVVTEYERQFRANTTRSYDLDDLQSSGGRAGRASAHYRVTRAGGSAIEGKIVLAAVRDRGGGARIGLIAVTPRA
ncbi:MAG: nuclear transport factor 2 family protein, partial [Actinomycetota bacterium]|nr:nuclear transport factor 2 family protein [Actinomycetota bacterium]